MTTSTDNDPRGSVSVLDGSMVRCRGCGRNEGSACVVNGKALEPGWIFPFNINDCPVCFARFGRDYMLSPNRWDSDLTDDEPLFDVLLTNTGDKKIHVIKEIRMFTNMGLKESKDLTDSPPSKIIRATLEHGRRICSVFDLTGATTVLVPAEGPNPNGISPVR